MTLDIVAIMSPRAGKADRVEELILNIVKYVKANEPDTLRYHLQRETRGDAPVLIMLETYKDKAALVAHAKTEAFQALNRTLKEEDLLAETPRLIYTKEAGGYASKL